jgi:hypothetical protein
MARKKIAIVILSYNTKELLQQCLDSLMEAENSKSEIRNHKPARNRCAQALAGGQIPISKSQTSKLPNLYKANKSERSKSLEIIVVDNGSTDGSRKYLRDLEIWRYRDIDKDKKKRKSSSKSPNLYRDPLKPQGGRSISLRVIFNDKNLGFTAGNNVGIKEAIRDGADYVCLLNSDTVVLNRFWEPIVEFMEKNREVGVATTKIYFAPGYEFHKDRYKKNERGKVIWAVGGEIDWKNVFGKNRGVDEVDQGQFEKPQEVDFASGCCLMAKSDVWQKVSFLDERYFMYYEDADFSQKAKKLGYKVFYVPGGKIWHFNAGSSEVGGGLQDYFISRNRLLFGLRWAPIRTKVALIRESIRLLCKGREWQRVGVRDFYLRRFGKGSWQ